MKKNIFFSLATLLVFYFNTESKAQPTTPESYVNTSNAIAFQSSDEELNNFFSWAKKQALSYAFEGDAVGLWYEAALPGREVFCMRDVSHQALGAHFLGLASHTKNMLRVFAANVTDARDWCSLWEVTRHGTPALQDYLNDSEFWYNLPANFDILDCCFRMYQLTGDMAYLNDPVFLNYYQRTVYDYVKRWNLEVDQIMSRKRFMNNQPDNNRRFKNNRGIPGYREGDDEYIASLDLIVTQQAAFEAYARIMLLRGEVEEASKFFEKSDEVTEFVNTVWWDEANQSYFTHLYENDKITNQGFDRSILLWGDCIKDPNRMKLAVQEMVDHLENIPDQFIELLSHMPEILYKYDQSEQARELLLAVQKNDRREYPEASFCSIGAIVSGLMGIEMETFPPRNALETGGFPEQRFITKSRLTDQTKWAQLDHVPLKRNSISVRHEGTTKTTFENSEGPQLQWDACFPGVHQTLLVDGAAKEASMKELPTGEKVSYVRLLVGGGESFTVEVPKN